MFGPAAAPLIVAIPSCTAPEPTPVVPAAAIPCFSKSDNWATCKAGKSIG